MRTVLEVPFRRVPVCIWAVATAISLQICLGLLLSALFCLTCPSEAPPCLTLTHGINKGGWDKDQLTKCPAQLAKRQTTIQVVCIHLKGEDDVHGGSTGPSAEEGTRHRHQPARTEVLPAGLWDSASAVSEEWTPVWGRRLSSWAQITGLQWAGTILVKDQGRCLEKASGKKHTQWRHSLYFNIILWLVSLTVICQKVSDVFLLLHCNYSIFLSQYSQTVQLKRAAVTKGSESLTYDPNTG